MLMVKCSWIRVFLPLLFLSASGTSRFTVCARAEGLPYGSIAGVVCDKESGKPLRFANIFLAGTVMGAMTQKGGTYTISAVPAGTYKAHAAFVGYEPLVSEVRVLPQQTTWLDFELEFGLVGRPETIPIR